jgi:hypothetical protein
MTGARRRASPALPRSFAARLSPARNGFGPLCRQAYRRPVVLIENFLERIASRPPAA